MSPSGRFAALGALMVMAVVPAPLAAQSSPPLRAPAAPTVRAVPGTIRVDGRLDDALYGTTDAIGSFVQQEPDEGEPATEKTEAWVFFDDDMIYVAARCFESRPERRVANEMRRDANQLRQNDTFAVLFDTFHDRRNGYLFTANAIGGMGDSQITDEGPPNVDWNTVWTFETGEFDGGWTVEMAIPFKSLRYQSGREQTWGINLRRVVRLKNEWSYLAQVPRALTTFRGILKVSSAATLVGLQVPSGTRMIELKPYALSGLATDTTVTPRLSNDATKRVGGDLKYGVTQNLTVDVTVNTDFAQVEVDEQQVNLTRFNLFFPEKRDFFLENLGTFAFAGRASAGLGAGSGVTPYLFFSRRIGLDGGRVPSLRAGGRLSGKAGRFTMGLLSVRTGELAPLEGQTQFIEPATFTVARVKRDILRRAASAPWPHIAARLPVASVPIWGTASTRRSRSIRTCVSTRMWPARRRKVDLATISVTAGCSTSTAIATGSPPSGSWSNRISSRRSVSCGEPTCGATSYRRGSVRGRRGYRTCGSSPHRQASTT